MDYKKTYEIEGLVLGSIILNPGLLGRFKITAEFFKHQNFRKAFNVLSEMSQNKETINLPLFGIKFLESGGKISEISKVLTDPVNCDNIFFADYVKVLAKENLKFKIKNSAHTLEDDAEKFIEEIKKLDVGFTSGKAVSLTDSIEDYLKTYNENKQRYLNNKSIGVPTGFDFIDLEAPLLPGHLVILGAKTSVGKTALALNIAVNSARYDQNVLFFSAEMTKHELITRALSQITNTPASAFKTGQADEALGKFKNEINLYGQNLKFVEAGAMSSSDVCRVVRQEAGNKKPDLIIVDYIQYLKDSVGNNLTNNDRIGNITRKLKEVALEVGAPVIALSQVKRATGIPTLADLRDSGNIEQDADIVFILHREDKTATSANLIVAKNRNGPVIFDHLLYFEHKIMTYSDLGNSLSRKSNGF
jgi:replicative DNA helicase